MPVSRRAIKQLIGIVGALLAAQAYPNTSAWLLIFPALAMMLLSIVHSSSSQALVGGWITGVVFYAAQIPWMTTYLGPVPWLALSVLEGLIFAVGALGINLAWRYGRSNLPHSPILLSLSIASLWTAREWVACNWPYGGFPWSRIGLSQSNSPLANWVYWGGTSLLSFVIVFLTALVLLTWRKQLKPENWGSSPVAALIAVVVMFPLITPVSYSNHESLKIAAVQGNANAGLFANPKPGSILQNHLNASRTLIDSNQTLDLVIWPENAADQNPLENSDSKWAIANFTSAVNAPLMFGTITHRGNDFYNSSILWQPGIGPVDWYDKKRPVAFGEFVPDRWLWRLMAPELIDLIPRGYSFGTRDGIFEINKAKLGTMICFEIAVDDISRDLVHSGAQILVVQTNNSDFGHSNESAQQLAIAKLRSIETGRALVNISTVGLSAIFLPNGKQIDSLPSYQAGVMVQDLPLTEAFTPAMWAASSLDLVNNFSAIAQIGLIVLLWRRGRRATK